MPSIKVTSARIEVRKDYFGQEQIVVRGTVEPDSLKDIRVPGYQRELLSDQKVEKIKKGWQHEQLPDISLGMRGSSILERESAIYLQDRVYVIDGLQRMTAALRLIEEGYDPRVGAMVYVDSTEPWERELFEALNIGQTKLATNVILRNRAEDHEAAKVMLRITEDKQCVMYRRVSWNQAMRRGDLITAVTYYKTVGRLHSFAGPGRSGDAIKIAEGLDKIIDNVGKNNFMFNVREYFAMINEVFGISNISYREHAIQLKSSFLMALAGIVSDHENFWEGDKLVIPPYIKKRLALFPVADPFVMQLAGSSGTASAMLEKLLLDHLNAGRKTRRLKLRSGLSGMELENEIGDIDGEEQ